VRQNLLDGTQHYHHYHCQDVVERPLALPSALFSCPPHHTLRNDVILRLLRSHSKLNSYGNGRRDTSSISWPQLGHLMGPNGINALQLGLGHSSSPCFVL